MPFAGPVKYHVGNFLRTGFDDASCSVITTISVIEHGFDAHALASEAGRLLKPGGHFVASFDYWPNKASTDGVNIFNMRWTIFSRQDVDASVGIARTFWLEPPGPLEYEAKERAISCFARDYTFGWPVLRKRS